MRMSIKRTTKCTALRRTVQQATTCTHTWHSHPAPIPIPSEIRLLCVRMCCAHTLINKHTHRTTPSRHHRRTALASLIIFNNDENDCINRTNTLRQNGQSAVSTVHTRNTRIQTLSLGAHMYIHILRAQSNTQPNQQATTTQNGLIFSAVRFMRVPFGTFTNERDFL